MSLRAVVLCALAGVAVFSSSSQPVSAQERIPIQKVTDVALGYSHTCALTESGDALCWGWNGHGQLRDGTTSDRTTPSAVVPLRRDTVALAAGGYASCAVTGEGGVKCWGGNFAGPLGTETAETCEDSPDRETPCSTLPLGVSGLSHEVTGIAAGFAFNCAVASEGGVKCWGANDRGQLGDGTTEGRTTPVDVVGLLEQVVGVAAADLQACAVL